MRRQILIGLIVIFLFSATSIFCSQISETDEAWLSRVQENIRKQEYEITWQDTAPFNNNKGAYQAPNRAQGFRTYFSRSGIKLVSRTNEAAGWELGLSLSAKTVEKQPGDQSGILAEKNRIEIKHGWITEWYVNDDKGLEQGFTILQPLRNGPLQIDLMLTGNLIPRFAEDGQAIAFFEEGGMNVLHYGNLFVKDASERKLDAKFEPIPGGIRISVDDKDAIYPVIIDPMVTTPAWTWEPDQALANFGRSVSTAGDVNGDGFSDVIISAYSYDNGQSNEGRVYVFHGSSSGLPSTPSWTAESDQVDAYFGISVSTAGDVNGDGYSDVIVGAYMYDNGQANEGRAFVFHGSASGLSAAANWTTESNQADAHFGYSVSAAGDITGDGYSDVLVSSPQEDNGETDEGRVRLYYGSSTGLNTTAAWAGQSNVAGAEYGTSVSTAGDVNADGYSDIIIGARYYTNGQTGEGRAYVYQGSNKGLPIPASPNWTEELDIAAANFGYSVSDAGDVNGDGYGDVIIAAPGTGLSYVYYGSSSGVGTSAAWSGTGASQVSGAGDANGDGFGDVVIASAGYDNGQTDEGAGFVYFGSSSGLPVAPDWTGESNQTNAMLGSCAGAGDVNGDGFSDIILGCSAYTNVEGGEGRAFLYYGSAAGIAAAPAFTRESNQANARFGLSVSTAGDVNGDGYSDILVGAPLYDNGQADEGAAFVYHGSASGPSVTADWTGESNSGGANYGHSVAAAGDINGDGYGDIIVGAPKFTDLLDEAGAVFAYYGSASGLAATYDWMIESDQGYSEFGCSVACAGDVNRDGHHDVIVGSRSYYVAQYWEGAAFVYHGSTTGLSTTPAWTGRSDQEDASFGFSVSTAGDINLDMYDDIIVGAPLWDNGNADEGAAFVYLGSATGVQPACYWRGESNQDGAWYGYSVSTAGLVNKDTAPEMIIGAPHYSNGQSWEGRAYIYTLYGLPDQSPEWTMESDQANACFGYAVGNAGDVNGDGYSDVVIGAPYYSNGQASEGRVYVCYNSATYMPDSYSTVESDQLGASLGISVSAAGDVNGDGFGDIIAGSSWYDNGETDEGRAFLYYGNKSGGAGIKPRQFRQDYSAQVVPALYTGSEDSFAARFNACSYYGRAIVKVEYQITDFSFLGGSTNYDTFETDWFELSSPGTEINYIFSSLSNDEFYKWRARLKFHPKYGEPIKSRWYSIQGNSVEEFDVRTGVDNSSDLDGDGVPNETDCLPLNNTIWAEPSEDLSVFKITRETADNLTWTVPVVGTWGSTSVTQDILRSVSSADFSTAVCRAADLSGSVVSFTDIEEPASGIVWYYLVRIENACGYQMGSGTDGIPRSGSGCP